MDTLAALASARHASVYADQNRKEYVTGTSRPRLHSARKSMIGWGWGWARWRRTEAVGNPTPRSPIRVSIRMRSSASETPVALPT
jgi:hypothetical protein